MPGEVKEGDIAADPVDLGDATPEPEAAAFDHDAEMPLDHFPEGMREQLKGKSFKDFAGDHAKMRQGFAQVGVKNKELAARITELEKVKPAADMTEEELDTLLQEKHEREIVSQPDYRAVLNGYFETDEIPEDFLEAITERGYRPSRRDTMKFLAFLKADREAKIQAIDTAAEGAVPGQDLWDWMESDDCTMSKESLLGMNDLAEEGDYGWVGTMVKKHQEWLDGGGHPARRPGKGRFSGPTRRGRPAPAPAGEQDIGKADFQTAWMDLTRKQSTGQISKADEKRGKRELTARRDRTLGVK